MGCAGSIQRNKIIAPHNIGKSNIRYQSNAKLQIKVKDGAGKQIGLKIVSFAFTKPFLFSSDSISNSFHLSKCVLPGIDPHGETEKKCQDICLYVQVGAGILLALFDGHGKEGEKVVALCASVVENFCKENIGRFAENPSDCLESLCITCDADVKKPGNGFDSISSGSTAVIVYVRSDGIFSASLGDSRAILATSAVPSSLPVPKAVNHIDSKHMYPAIQGLFPVQLTRDQKPEDADEYSRILKSGGIVKRINDNGKQVGPYRVFDNGGKYPGLAMSRSIGDASGSALGVIAIPICTSFLITGQEKFIVLASDGVWDVMDNEDVVTFVETYRAKCLQHGDPPLEVDCFNTIVAQLLCEEARVRWLAIVTDEDVLIDDISCVILQFKAN